MQDRETQTVPLYHKYALTLKEVVQYFGIGERKLQMRTGILALSFITVSSCFSNVKNLSSGWIRQTQSECRKGALNMVKYIRAQCPFHYKKK